MSANNLQQHLVFTLSRAADRLREAELPRDLVGQVERLAQQIYEPCVVAVVGRVKAGKSSFINAFLEDDLAKVGTTETTATINYFRYGHPPVPDRPIRCYWRNGKYTDVDRRFLDGLQGNDIEVLRRADGIDHLEYFLLNPQLKQVTLVDTPGTGAVIEEHQNRTAEFMQLSGQLRERHDQQTQRIGNEADAVIYLIGQVAHSTDRDFLEEFHQVTQNRSRALNAVGVMAKIDLYPEVIERRAELAAKIATQLRESLNTVIPVSAGMQRALQYLLANNQISLVRLMNALRGIPTARLQKLLANDVFYREYEFSDCPVTITQRKELLADMPWTVFTTIARIIANPALSTADIAGQLHTISGFGPLKDVLDRHFFKRGQLLRCYRIMNDARRILNIVKFSQLPEFRKRDQEDKRRLERFISFIRQSHGDPAIAAELEAFIRGYVAGRTDKLQAMLQELDREFGHAFHELEQHNADFAALQLIEDHANLFSGLEQDELLAVLGLYGVEIDKRLPLDRRSVGMIQEQQQLWRQISMQDRNSIRRDVAQRAVVRYGLILGEMASEAASR